MTPDPNAKAGRLFARLGTGVMCSAQVLGLAAVVAGGAMGIARARETMSVPNATVTMPASMVVATKPNIGEIADMILARPDKRGFRAWQTGGDQAFKVSQILRHYTKDGPRADRIARALVREGERQSIAPALLVGVLLVENPWLDPTAKSPVGARGLMQVMPFHGGKWGCDSRDLFDIESNICHGVKILAQNLKDSRSLHTALLAYNGCVRGTNTPNCGRYSSHVLKYANSSARVLNGSPVYARTLAAIKADGARRPAPRKRGGGITLPRELLVE